MPQNTHLEIISAEAERWPETWPETTADLSEMRRKAARGAALVTSLPNAHAGRYFVRRCRTLKEQLKPLWSALDAPLPKAAISDDFRWLHDNARLLYSMLQDVTETARTTKVLPQARLRSGERLPRVLVLAWDYLEATDFSFDERSFTAYVDAYQETAVLDLDELWALAPCLKLVLLEAVAERAPRVAQNPQGSCGVAACIRSLHDIGEIS